MKKVVFIAFIVLGATSCQKEVFTPSSKATENVTLRGTSTDPIVDEPTTSPDGDGGEITDPLRKRDKKDSK
jgi:hypothetical protein